MIDDCVVCWAGLFCKNGNTLHPTSANESTKVMNILKAVVKRFCNFCISRPVSADTACHATLRSKVLARPMAPLSNGTTGQKTVCIQWQRSSNGAARPNHTTLTIRLTRNPTCPNRWGTHKRCRFIGGWRYCCFTQI